MTNYISMLRGINVSGQKKIKMEALKNLYESLNFKNVKTYIQSGNVVFDSKDSSSLITKNIENKIKETFGFDVKVLIRTKDEFKKVIENNPFKGKEIDKIYVIFLSEVPLIKPVDEINTIKDKKEEFAIFSKEVYLYLPNNYGRTKLNNNFFERKLKVNGTTRNLRTVNKLFEIAS